MHLDLTDEETRALQRSLPGAARQAGYRRNSLRGCAAMRRRLQPGLRHRRSAILRGGHGRDGEAGKAAMTLGTQEAAGLFARTAMRGSVAALVLSGSIYAAFGADLSKEYTECLNSMTTNVQLEECSKQEIDRQEKSLTEAWKETYATMKKISERAAQTLLDEQRAWVKFKDAACLFFLSGDFDREGVVLRFGVCRAPIIAQRVEALKALMQDLSSGP
jgi:uncharacterized protein YecT (DUF1311 family)